MSDNIPIPREVVEAHAKKFLEVSFCETMDEARALSRLLVAAALAAWPGADTAYTFGGVAPARLILPLPQEARDE